LLHRDKKELRLASQSKNVAKVGVYLSAAGNDLSLAVNALIESFSAEKKTTDFSEFYTYSKKSLNNFKKANKYLNKIDASSVPEEYREQFIELQAKAKVLKKNMDDFVEMIPALEDFLGIKTD
jgi:outer membrane protein assembly factor BamD (BamD/ComL family)